MPGFGIAVFALVLFVTVGCGLLLYAAVRAEHDHRQPMDRETAERVARRDTGEPPANRGWDQPGRRDRDEGCRRDGNEGRRRDQDERRRRDEDERRRDDRRHRDRWN